MPKICPPALKMAQDSLTSLNNAHEDPTLQETSRKERPKTQKKFQEGYTTPKILVKPKRPPRRSKRAPEGSNVPNKAQEGPMPQETSKNAQQGAGERRKAQQGHQRPKRPPGNFKRPGSHQRPKGPPECRRIQKASIHSQTSPRVSKRAQEC